MLLCQCAKHIIRNINEFTACLLFVDCCSSHIALLQIYAIIELKKDVIAIIWEAMRKNDYFCK